MRIRNFWDQHRVREIEALRAHFHLRTAVRHSNEGVVRCEIFRVVVIVLPKLARKVVVRKAELELERFGGSILDFRDCLGIGATLTARILAYPMFELLY